MTILDSDGYKSLLAAVEKDELKSPGFHDYRGKLAWVVARAAHYAEVTGLGATDILNAWEKQRSYWYMNFYQESNQPALNTDKAKVFASQQVLIEAIGNQGFRCPNCGGVSRSAYECDSGLDMSPGKVCDWKVWGLFGHLGKGIFVFAIDAMRGEAIFMPIAWEQAA